MFIGELISLGVALSWTATALFAEVGSKRMGSLPFNTIRMTMSLLLLNKDGLAQLHHAVSDRKAMWCVLAQAPPGTCFPRLITSRRPDCRSTFIVSATVLL